MKKILLVDDDEDLLLVLGHALTANRYHVMAIADPAIVMQTIESFNPAIIILDINLGAWDGRKICQALKENKTYGWIPVIFYSGIAEEGHTFLQTRACLFLSKPLSTNFFLKKIAEIIAVG